MSANFIYGEDLDPLLHSFTMSLRKTNVTTKQGEEAQLAHYFNSSNQLDFKY